jgi:PAS domain S-box-containing protein
MSEGEIEYLRQPVDGSAAQNTIPAERAPGSAPPLLRENRHNHESVAEAALAEPNRRLDAVLNNATVAVFLMDERQHCAYMNPAAERLTGYTFQETQGRPLHDVIHHTRPDGTHFPLHECAIDRAFPENSNTKGEETFIHKDGHFYPVAFTASPIYDNASRTIGTIIEVRDISIEKAREAALRESNDRLASERHALEVLSRTGTRLPLSLT